MDIHKLVEAGRDLVGDCNNPEYVRAVVELVGEFLPGDSDQTKAYLYPLIAGVDYAEVEKRERLFMTHNEMAAILIGAGVDWAYMGGGDYAVNLDADALNRRVDGLAATTIKRERLRDAVIAYGAAVPEGIADAAHALYEAAKEVLS